MILATPGTPAQRSQRIASASTTCSSANDSDVSTARAPELSFGFGGDSVRPTPGVGLAGSRIPNGSHNGLIRVIGVANLPVALVNGARIDLDERGPQDALNAAQRPVLLSGEAYHADDFKT
jgi:hypothetical protein